uniref:Uncharacterized protein n=1 Tax=Anguilla anguilla TaxID=7936 RepID=A0A0E9U4N1_ANGAN
MRRVHRQPSNSDSYSLYFADIDVN